MKDNEVTTHCYEYDMILLIKYLLSLHDNDTLIRGTKYDTIIFHFHGDNNKVKKDIYEYLKTRMEEINENN
jgi:hypothetical protein